MREKETATEEALAESGIERDAETPEKSIEQESDSKIMKRADSIISDLSESGLGAAVRLAGKLEFPLDPGTEKEFGKIIADAQEAKKELERDLRMSVLAGKLTRLDSVVSKFITENGEVDNDALEKSGEGSEVSELIEEIRGDIDKDPAVFLDSAANLLRDIQSHEIRESFVRDASFTLLETDPNGLAARCESLVSTGTISEEFGKELKNDVTYQIRHNRMNEVRDLLGGNPITLANKYAELVRDFPRREGDTGEDSLRSLIIDRVKTLFKGVIDSGEDVVTLYKQLADSSHVRYEVADLMVRSIYKKGTERDFARSKRLVMEELGDVMPDMILERSSPNSYEAQFWTDEEKSLLIDKLVSLPKSRLLELTSDLSLPILPSDLGDVPRKVLFEVFSESKPEEIFKQASAFSKEISELSDEELMIFFQRSIEKKPSDIWPYIHRMPMSPEQKLKLLSWSADHLVAPRLSVIGAMYEGEKMELNEVFPEEKLTKIAIISLKEDANGTWLAILKGNVPFSNEQITQVLSSGFEFGWVPDSKYLEKLALERGFKLSLEAYQKLIDKVFEHAVIVDLERIESIERLARHVEPKADALDKRVRYMKKIVSSPSSSVRRIAPELWKQIQSFENPESVLDEVEDIFERNHLPLVGKVFKVFETLYPKERLSKMVLQEYCSPTLKAERYRSQMYTVYKDLLRSHLDSDNPSLRGYLRVLQEGQTLADKVDAGGVDSLTEEEVAKFEVFTDKLKRLYEVSLRGKEKKEKRDEVKESEAIEIFKRVRESMGVSEGQSLSERVSEMYLKPLGLKSVEQALERMDAVKSAADNRNREYANSGQGIIEIKAGDLLKGIDSSYVRNILENGSVAKEFLGASADSDSTPFDTDLSKVLPKDIEGNDIFSNSIARTYGDTIMVIRDRGQFYETSADDSPADLARIAMKRESRMELFHTPVAGERHYGIRTGFPSTEIDAIIPTMFNRRKFDALAMDIVANGCYIPIVDYSLQVLLTPEKYDEYRDRFYSGLNGKRFELARSVFETAPHYKDDIDEIIAAKRKEDVVIEGINNGVKKIVVDELKSRGISTSDGYDELLINAEIYETGSSSRGTAIPGSYDFDYAVKLNANDEKRVKEINDALVSKLGGKRHEAHRTEQLRLIGAKIGQEVADIDIGFVSKNEEDTNESHEAVSDRLESIRRELGEKACEFVKANIILAKKVLKEAQAYKKYENGGIGGIGVENWILSEGGNMLSAFESFERAAFDGVELRYLAEFQDVYKVLDPGVNVKTGGHDSYMEMLTPEGYKKMAMAIKNYFDSVRMKMAA